eukprot:COSAG06_NODE_493_length_15060_cov_50.594546_4_plen_82_part_00
MLICSVAHSDLCPPRAICKPLIATLVFESLCLRPHPNADGFLLPAAPFQAATYEAQQLLRSRWLFPHAPHGAMIDCPASDE